MHADDAAFWAYFLGVLWKLALFVGVPLYAFCYVDKKGRYGLGFWLYLRWKARQESEDAPERGTWAERFQAFRDRKIRTDWTGDEDDEEVFEVFGAPARRMVEPRRRDLRPEAE